MDFLMAGWSLLDRGGWVMYAILGLSVVGAALILLKMYQFQRAGVSHVSFVPAVMKSLASGDIAVAKQKLQKESCPLARVMETAVDTAGHPDLPPPEREAEVTRVGESEVHNLETYMRGLELIGNISPLMGLLGTVTGMIKAFQVIQSSGDSVDPATLAGGIWEALLTTAFGLVVAIPVLAAFYLLDATIERLRMRMQDTGSEILSLLADRLKGAEAAVPERQENAAVASSTN